MLSIFNRLWTRMRPLWIPFFLLYSIAFFGVLVFGVSVPSLLFLPYLLFIPGYALVSILFPRSPKFEKTFMSIGFSIALFVGIKSLIQAFRLGGTLSGLPLLVIVSALCLIINIIFNRSK